MALLEARALAAGASTVARRRQWTSRLRRRRGFAVTWHRCRRWDWSACAEGRLAQSLLDYVRRAARCCARPFGAQLPTDWPCARWGWLWPRYAQRGRSPVVHAYEEMTGCTAAQCSSLRLTRASIRGACSRRICAPSVRCRPSRQPCCRAYSARGVFRWVLTEHVRPIHAHIRLLSGAPGMGCTSRVDALVGGLCKRGRFALSNCRFS